MQRCTLDERALYHRLLRLARSEPTIRPYVKPVLRKHAWSWKRPTEDLSTLQNKAKGLLVVAWVTNNRWLLTRMRKLLITEPTTKRYLRNFVRKWSETVDNQVRKYSAVFADPQFQRVIAKWPLEDARAGRLRSADMHRLLAERRDLFSKWQAELTGNDLSPADTEARIQALKVALASAPRGIAKFVRAMMRNIQLGWRLTRKQINALYRILNYNNSSKAALFDLRYNPALEAKLLRT